MKRLLLTGATGFIGRHCIPPLLRRGYQVHAVSSKPAPLHAQNVTWHHADLLAPGSVENVVHSVRPSHLLHCAWFTEPGGFWTSSENLRWVEASLALLRAFARNGGERVVTAGSCAEYDWRYGFCSEGTTPLQPRTLYGMCKHSLQMMDSAFAAQAGLRSAWGRVFFLYGPHEQPGRLVSSVIPALLAGEAAACSHGDQIRDFLYVEDIASAFVAVLDSPFEGAVNIGSGRPLAVRDLVMAIANRTGCPELVRFGATSTKADDPPFLVADTRKLRNEVGWSPQYTLEEGVERTIAWWRDRAPGGTKS